MRDIVVLLSQWIIRQGAGISNHKLNVSIIIECQLSNMYFSTAKGEPSGIVNHFKIAIGIKHMLEAKDHKRSLILLKTKK